MAEKAPVLIQGPPLSSINGNAPFCFEADDEIPNVDYSMLISADPKLRSQAIESIGKACLDYGCFIVTNHVVPESLMTKVLEHCLRFFDMTVEEKQEYQPKNTTYRIGWGKPGDHREFLKLVSHPNHYFPTKPAGFSEILQEYCKITREMAMELLGGISKSLGQEESYIEKAMKLQSGFDICAMNAYPPNSQSNNKVGLPAHTDPSLLILIIENVNGGFQLQRDGKWINVTIAPNSILVNIGEHLEILTNGKYKSPIHRVMGNNNVRRVGMPNAFGPSLDAFVSPAPEFVDQNHSPVLYAGQTYAEFWESRHYNSIEEKIMLNIGST